jgi:hypothetical protein
MPSYYPPTNDGRGGWWQNIVENGTSLLTEAGLSPTQITSIVNDASWAVFAYSTVRQTYDDFSKSVTRYAHDILTGTPGGGLPPAPAPPAFPELPLPPVAADIEARRELWVQQVKKSPGYSATIGTALGIETSAKPFNPASYVCELYGVVCQSPHTVSGKFRKAGGQVDSIHLYGRKNGMADWTLLGTFTATPFTASIPVAATTPEQWEFQARAMHRDAEFGLPSAIQPAVILP